jgi:hypothetical protein
VRKADGRSILCILVDIDAGSCSCVFVSAGCCAAWGTEERRSANRGARGTETKIRALR